MSDPYNYYGSNQKKGYNKNQNYGSHNQQAYISDPYGNLNQQYGYQQPNGNKGNKNKNKNQGSYNGDPYNYNQQQYNMPGPYGNQNQNHQNHQGKKKGQKGNVAGHYDPYGNPNQQAYISDPYGNQTSNSNDPYDNYNNNNFPNNPNDVYNNSTGGPYQQQNQKVCQYYLKGHCKKGNKCHFSHTRSVQQGDMEMDGVMDENNSTNQIKAAKEKELLAKQEELKNVNFEDLDGGGGDDKDAGAKKTLWSKTADATAKAEDSGFGHKPNTHRQSIDESKQNREPAELRRRAVGDRFAYEEIDANVEIPKLFDDLERQLDDQFDPWSSNEYDLSKYPVPLEPPTA